MPDCDDTIDQPTYELLQDLMGEQGFAEVIDFFCSDTEQAIGNLRHAIAEQQADCVGGICHKLKSSSKLIGAFDMAELSTKLEQYTENKDTQLAIQLLDKLETEFRCALHWIEKNKTLA